MFQKIKRGFLIYFSTLWISMLALLMAADRSKGVKGLQVNGFLAFIIWVSFMFIMVKISISLADIGFLVLYIIIGTVKFGINEELVESIVIAALLIGIPLLYFRHRSKIDTEVMEKHQRGVECCRRCGSSRIQYIQPHEVHDDRVEHIYDSWTGGDYAVQAKHVVEGHYKCNNCGNTWR